MTDKIEGLEVWLCIPTRVLWIHLGKPDPSQPINCIGENNEAEGGNDMLGNIGFISCHMGLGCRPLFILGFSWGMKGSSHSPPASKQ